MRLETLQAVAELMERHGLTHVKFDDDELGKLEMDRQAAGPIFCDAAPSDASAPASSPAPAPAPAPEPAPQAPISLVASPQPVPASDFFEVEAPMVGVFYEAPSPGAEPFVRVGSKVRKGDTLCIVEAMKCMNEVTAEVDGTVVDICANDGELVEYGRCLMRLS